VHVGSSSINLGLGQNNSLLFITQRKNWEIKRVSIFKHAQSDKIAVILISKYALSDKIMGILIYKHVLSDKIVGILIFKYA